MKAGPSRAWYWVGGAIVVGGMAAAVLWGIFGFVSLGDEIDGFVRVPADGGGQITLTEDGGYTIYYESRSAGSHVPEGHVAVVPAGGSEPVTLHEYGGDLTYNFAGRAGQALFTFEIGAPGRYVVDSSSEGQGNLAFGRSVGGRLVATIVGAVLLGLGCVMVGVIVLIVTGVRRNNASRSPGPPGSPGAAPWPPSVPPA